MITSTKANTTGARNKTLTHGCLLAKGNHLLGR